MMVFRREPKPEKRGDRAVACARRGLARDHATLFSSVFWYGAVDIDLEHLVVWVLLPGAPTALPAWFFPPDTDLTGRYEAELLAEIDAMRRAVVACFAEAGWPDADRVRVGFDSEVRVREGGGWHYFK